jgi:hypothetical protein
MGAPLNGPGGGVQILPAPAPGQPAIQPLPIRRPFPFQIQLQVGQDGLFSVNKHNKESFFVTVNYQSFVSRENNPNFETTVKSAKQVAKVQGDPVAALKSADKDDRYTAAAVLISKYRTFVNTTGQPMKQVQIDAEESKLILKALAEGDWKQANMFNQPIQSPFQLFNQLGINQQDGYNTAGLRTQQDILAAQQKWLDENKDKYRIQKWAVDPNAKPVQPGVLPGRPGGVPVPGVLPAPGGVGGQPGNPGVVQPGVVRPGVRIQPAPAPVQPAPQDK